MSASKTCKRGFVAEQKQSNDNHLKKQKNTNDDVKTLTQYIQEGASDATLEALIQNGVDVNANSRVDGRGSEALREACRRERPYVISLLLKHGALCAPPSNDSDSAMSIVARSGHIPSMIALLDGGANIAETVESVGDPCLEALGVACVCGHDELVRLLLERGAPIQTNDSNHALWMAAVGGECKVLQTILQCRPLECSMGVMRQALEYAIMYGHPHATRFLLDQGVPMPRSAGSLIIDICDDWSVDEDRRTHCTRQDDRLELLRLLVARGFQITGKSLRHAMRKALACRYSRIVAYLFRQIK